MKTEDLLTFPQEGNHLLFTDTVKDDLTVTGARLQTCRFNRIGARDAYFKDCALTQCLFEDAYLRKARFVNVQLTGSTFRNCNLEKASFSGCDLRYCKFEKTHLDRHEIIGNFPTEPNLRRDLARNLRKNFESIGDKESADVFLKLEIAAHELELFAALRRKTEYYRSRYTPMDQAVAGLQFVTSKVSGFLWGYGYRVRRLVLSYLFFTLALALITFFFELPFAVDTQISVRSLGLWESIYYNFAGTLGITTSALSPVSAIGMSLQIFSGFLGTLFLALLAAATYRAIAR